MKWKFGRTQLPFHEFFGSPQRLDGVPMNTSRIPRWKRRHMVHVYSQRALTYMN